MKPVGPTPTFGVEEEYLLLDEQTGMPVDRAAQLERELGETELDREFFESQVETATPICKTGEEAERALREFRAAASHAAAGRNAVLAGTGLPPVGGDTAGTVTPQDRYRAIQAELRGAADAQYLTGTHVHVEVPSRDAGVEVMARLARWAPALIAMTANSPLWCGVDTGFASWRHLMAIAWPIGGYPPEFRDGAEYTASVTQLVGSGALLDSGVVTWAVRLSENYPTVELRIADAQLDPADAVAFGVLVRALVSHALTEGASGTDRPRIAPGMVAGATWLAARDGLQASLIDPVTGSADDAFAEIDRMVSTASGELDRAGDTDRVAAYLERLRSHGGPAQRQRERFAATGIPGLLDLYRAGSAPAPAGT